MSPEEKTVISGIFDRLGEVADQPRDPEAERYIAERVRAQPYAPYAMAQTIHIQEQALTNLQREVEALRAELEEASRQLEEASRRPRQSGGILGSLFGGGAAPTRDPGPAPGGPWGNRGAPDPRWGGAPAAGPWQQPTQQPMQQPMQPPMPPQGGGFLSGALSTAVGVAGGVMLANTLSHAFSQGGSSSRLSEGLGLPGGTRLLSEDSKAEREAGKGESAGRDDPTRWGDAGNDADEDDDGGFDSGDFSGGDFGGSDSA